VDAYEDGGVVFEESRIRVLIADDDPAGCRRMAKMLEPHEDFELAGTVHSAASVARVVSELSPDLLFLEVEMPKMDGFHVLKSIDPDKLPLTILMTEHHHDAVRAFEVHALDYLIKPLDQVRLRRALDHAKNSLAVHRKWKADDRIFAFIENMQKKASYAGRIVARKDNRIYFLKVEEIDWIKADGRHVSVQTGDQSFLVRQSIGELEGRLNPEKFIRIHRSVIVNVDQICEMQPWFHGDYRVFLANGTELLLSRNRRDKLHSLLGTP
jgi:two-component system, LytTR family, response regulator